MHLAGTGGPLGWPQPGCPCASCALATADPRGPLQVSLHGNPLDLASGPVADGSVLLALDASIAPPAHAYAVALLRDADLTLLAHLRRIGAVGDRTDIIAVGLTHAHRPGDALTTALEAVGVRVLPDGGEVTYVAPKPRPRRTLVLGGARSGKSAEAERLLLGDPDVTYVATAPHRDGDADWDARVRRHRERRPKDWTTVETTELVPLLSTDGHPLLVDDLGLWLTTVIDAAGAWEGRNRGEVARRVDELVTAWRSAARRVVSVSPEVGSGVVPATRSGRVFRDELGSLNARLAAESEQVLQVVAGRVLVL